MDHEFFTTPVTSLAERALVYDLRREAFAGDGPLGAPPVLTDRYDNEPNCQSYLLYRKGDSSPAGSIQASLYSEAFDWRPIPAFDLYGEEIRNALGLRTSLVQSSHFCVSPRHRSMSLLPKLLLIREVLRTAVGSGGAYVLTIVKNQPGLLRFYERMGFEPFGPARIHPLSNNEAVLIGVETGRFLQTVRARAAFRVIGAFGDPPESVTEWVRSVWAGG